MPPDEDGEGRGQGLAMLRLEARRYKREMQQIWMQRQLYEQKKAAASFYSEDSSRVRDDRWRFSDTCTNSPATSGTPVFWNREDVPVSSVEQLVIVEEGTQTDTLSKSEVQTETEKLQYDDAVISSVREGGTVSSAANRVSMLKTCSRHCDELRSTISQEAACECLKDSAVRVNADVVFTAKPKRAAVEGPVETREDETYPRAFRPVETGIVPQTSAMATSPTGGLNKDQRSTYPLQDLKTGLRSLVSPVRRHDTASSPIRSFHEYGAGFTRLRDTSEGTIQTEMFSWQRERSTSERPSTIAPPSPPSTQVSAPQPGASRGGLKAGDKTSDFYTEISGREQICNESTEECVMAARLATKIKHALEAIDEKAKTRSANSTFSLPQGRAVQSTSACRLHYKDQCSEMKEFEDADVSRGGRTLNDKETASSDSSLPETCPHARKEPVSSGQHHNNSTPCSNAEIYFQNMMAALSTDRHTGNRLSGGCIAGEVSAARVAQRAERRSESTRRASVKACGDHHASHQADEIENSVKTDVRQSGGNHVMEKQRLSSNVQKLQNVAETAKRLYSDLVDCAYDELRASTDCKDLVKHQDEDRARDVPKFATPEFCPSTEIISAHRADVASAANNEVCGRCIVCQPQFINEQPPEEAQIDSLDEITIELSDASPTNIMVSRNDCTERPGYNVEVSTPCDLTRQRVCSPKNPCGNIVSRGKASWKDSQKPATRRTRSACFDSNQQVKKGLNKCLVDPHCEGPRDCCHMPTRGKCSRASSARISSPKKSSKKCLLRPQRDGLRNSCCMPRQAKSSEATTIYISPPKKSVNKCLLNPHCDGPRNSCHMATSAKCSGATTINISPPKKDSNLCCLDPHCVGPWNSCHMPTYEKNSQASCGLGKNSRIKHNNGTKNHFGSFQCSLHDGKGVKPLKEKFESSSCHGRFQNDRSEYTKNHHDDKPCSNILHERKHNSLAIQDKFSKGCLDEISQVGALSEAKDHTNLCLMHDDIRRSSLKEKEFKVGGLEETPQLHHFSSERTNFNNPVNNVHRSFQECHHIGVVKKLPTLTAVEDIKNKTAFVGKEPKQPTVKHMTKNVFALNEAYTQTMQSHDPQSNDVDRAVAAARLAKEIEVMIVNQLDKSNCRIKKPNYLTSQRKHVEVHKDSFGQTKLDVAVIAAANAVKKLKPISLLPLIKQDEGNKKATTKKGLISQPKLMVEDNIGTSFYDQMYKELEELSSERMQLVWHEQAQSCSKSSFFPLQEQNKHARFYVTRSSSNLKNLMITKCELEESRRSLRVQQRNGSPSFWNEQIKFHTPSSKRQRSATSPAREYGNKLLRLNTGKAESKDEKKKQGQHSMLSTSINHAIRKSREGLYKMHLVNLKSSSTKFLEKKENSIFELDTKKKLNVGLTLVNKTNNLSMGRWKLAPKEVQAKIVSKKRISTTRKIKSLAWVERMSKAKNVFTNLLQPLLLAHYGKEQQLEATTRKRTLRPLGFVLKSLKTYRQFGMDIPKSRVFPLMQCNASNIHSKESIVSNQYDIGTGRKIIHSEQELNKLTGTKVEKQHIYPTFKNLHKKKTRIVKRPIIKHDVIHSTMTNLKKNHVKLKAWNADPTIKSDIPHQVADIIRYNRNANLDMQIYKPNSGHKEKSSLDTSIGQMNVRHVTFAGTIVHNSHIKKRRKNITMPQTIVLPQAQIVDTNASILQPSRIEMALEKNCNSSTTKLPSIPKILQRHGGGGKKWTYSEGFWTETFKSEFEDVSLNSPIQNILIPVPIAQPNTSILELNTTQIVENDTFLDERASSEDLLTVESSFCVKKTNDKDVLDMAKKRGYGMEKAQIFTTDFEPKSGCNVKKNVLTNKNEKSQNPLLFKNLGICKVDDFEHNATMDHHNIISKEEFSSLLQNTNEDKQRESCSETTSIIMPELQAQTNVVDYLDYNRLKQQEPKLAFEEYPQLPLQFLDNVFPINTKKDSQKSVFDYLQATSISVEAHSEEPHLVSNCISQQTSMYTHDHENKVLLKKLELEQTLMDIALHTILHDDPLQVPKDSATKIEPISLPKNRRMTMQVDKEVEAIVHAHDMSQSPFSKAFSHIDKSTEHNIMPQVDRATEFDTMPYIDRTMELDNSFIFFKDQNSQTMDAELETQNAWKCTSPTQTKPNAKITQVHHQANECGIPWNVANTQMPIASSTTTTSHNFPTTIPMLMPIFFQQLGTNVLPMVCPNVNFSTSSNLQPPPINVVSNNLLTRENQEIQTTESHVQPNSNDIATQIHQEVLELPITNKANFGQLDIWEEKKNSNWKYSKSDSSLSTPSTPSTPLSSPNHKMNLKKAMQLYPKNPSTQIIDFAKKDLQPLILEVCQVSENNCFQEHQNLENDLTPPIQVVTEMVMEEMTTQEPPLILNTNGTRRGISWAKAKEMEKKTLRLLRAASLKIPTTTSSSECSIKTSIGLFPWMSPGEVNIEEIDTSMGNRHLLGNYNFHTHLDKPTQSHSWSWFNCGQTSIGEVHNPISFLGHLSEGEIEAGIVPSLGELGQIQNTNTLLLHPTTNLQSQGFEPGEWMNANASSTQQKSPIQPNSN